MEDQKTPLQSLTVLSAASSAILSLLGAFGVSVDPALAGQAVNGAAQLASAAMAAVAVYGRIRATTRIARKG